MLLVEAFNRLDTDKNGYLDAHETMELVRDIHKCMGRDPASFTKVKKNINLNKCNGRDPASFPK